MKPGMRMMMLDKMRQEDHSQRSEYGGGNDRRMIGYDRDAPRHGDVPPMNGPRYDPPGIWPGWERPPMGRYDDEPEARRRRDSRGRYAVKYPEHDDDDEEDYSHHKRHERKGELLASGSVWMNPGMGRRDYPPVDERQAMEWVHEMEAPEGGRPMPAFRFEETEVLRKAHCPECDKWEFFVTMNMKYSDLFEYAKKLGMDKPEFYAYMAKAFLCDNDAGPYKLQKYMEVIPKK